MIPDDQKKSFVEELAVNTATVFLMKRGDIDVGGNAFVVAPYLAITATHVLFANKFASFSDSKNSLEEHYYEEESFNLLIYSAKYQSVFVLNVAKAISVPNTDITILFLQDTSGKVPDDVWNRLELCLRPPEIGEHVFCLGSVYTKNDYRMIDGNLNLAPRHIPSFGSVLDFKIRKSQIEPFPGFYAELTSFNTLSGSPVYNKDKQVVGFISQYFDGFKKPTTFVSVIYPIFINKVEWEPKSLKKTTPYYLYDLAVKGVINCKSLETIEMKDGEIKIWLPASLKE